MECLQEKYERMRGREGKELKGEKGKENGKRRGGI